MAIVETALVASTKFVSTGFPPVSTQRIVSPIEILKLENTGHGVIRGTVGVEGETGFSTLHRKISIFRQKDGLFLSSIWSNAVTGAYEFKYLDEKLSYFVIAFDYTGEFGALIGDNIRPEIIT